jgi:flagellar biogenesis protein FliO
MAQRIGPTIWFACIVALAACAAVAQAADPAKSSNSPAPAPYLPTAERDRVDRATYERPIDAAREPAAQDKGAPHAGRRELPPTPSSGPALLSMLGSLVFVLAIFFGLIWLLRRGMPKGTRVVPSEVIEVLGRAPLVGRQQMHVVRFGNKLLLVSLSPGGAETLSEITEPAEVDRLAGICQQSQSNSATNAFRHVFRQFGEDRSFFRGKKAGSTVAARRSTSADLEDDDV